MCRKRDSDTKNGQLRDMNVTFNLHIIYLRTT